MGNKTFNELSPIYGATESVVVEALEDGVTVIGVTRGSDNKILHTENLKKGEVWIAQFTEHISAMKIRGLAKVHTKYGVVESSK
ncbi:MAG: trp RNA-binding attenuation protein MtrB [Synergistaceae bacterium]|jgi:transcription attenuation protein (tryptophan RNA-binding attenuator protein)|nr:trp RNA-binding attenuation protein MtrB [Synergistaceae bacterium]